MNQKTELIYNLALDYVNKNAEDPRYYPELEFNFFKNNSALYIMRPTDRSFSAIVEFHPEYNVFSCAFYGNDKEIWSPPYDQIIQSENPNDIIISLARGFMLYDQLKNIEGKLLKT